MPLSLIQNGFQKHLQMEIDDKILEDITKAASCGYTPKMVALMLGLPVAKFESFIKDEENAVSIAYYTGFLSRECAVRESVMALACSGSSPAQTQALKIFNETRTELSKGEFPGFTDEG